MKGKVKSVSAIGTRGEVKGKIFSARVDSNGKYVLNRKNSKPSEGNTTNLAVNKTLVDTLDEAVELLATDDYRINLVTPEGQRALRQFKKVIIEHY